jgi:hypothetical protein
MVLYIYFSLWTIGLRISLYQQLSKLRTKILRRFFANFCHENGCENDQTYIFQIQTLISPYIKPPKTYSVKRKQTKHVFAVYK